jgi:hypothetical protein
MLLLMEYGSEALPPDNPSHVERLRRHLAKAQGGKGKGNVEEAERRLRQVPQVYGFNQDVVLAGHVHTPEHASGLGEGGWTVSPHWRRGHWRGQRYGPQLSLLKRILIKPVLVHAAHFLGQLSGTKAVYRQQP